MFYFIHTLLFSPAGAQTGSYNSPLLLWMITTTLLYMKPVLTEFFLPHLPYKVPAEGNGKKCDCKLPLP